MATTLNSQTTIRPIQTELGAVGEGIVSRLSTVLDHKIGVTNLSGNLIADSDLSNFDKFSPSALSAIQKGAPTPLLAGEIDDMAGWVIPLRHQDRILGTLIIRNNPAPSDDVIPLAKSLSELLLYQMLIMDKIAQENRVLDKFFYDLFEGRTPHEKLLRDSLFFNSQFFHIDFSEPRNVVSIILKDFWRDVFKNQPILPSDEHKLTVVKDQLGEIFERETGLKNTIIAYLGQDEFVAILPHNPIVDKDDKKKKSQIYSFSQEQMISAAKVMAEKFEREAHIGIGQFQPEIGGLIRSYQGAKKAAQLGLKLMPGQRVYYYSELLLPIMLEQSDAALQKQFVDNELGTLTKFPELVETLSTHFDSNLNLKKTAYELGIHKNTLYYRLAKIKKVLNADPQEFNQAVRLKVALYLWQMQRDEDDQEYSIN